MKLVEGKIIETSNGTYPEYKDGQPTGQTLPFVHLVLVDKNAHPVAVAAGLIQRYNLNILFDSAESYEGVKAMLTAGCILPFYKEVVKVAPFGRIWGANTSRAGQIVSDANGAPVIYDELLVISIKEDLNAATEALRIRNRGIKQGTMFEPTPGDAHQENPAVADNNMFVENGQQQGGQQQPMNQGQQGPVNGQQPGNGRSY